MGPQSFSLGSCCDLLPPGTGSILNQATLNSSLWFYDWAVVRFSHRCRHVLRFLVCLLTKKFLPLKLGRFGWRTAATAAQSDSHVEEKRPKDFSSLPNLPVLIVFLFCLHFFLSVSSVTSSPGTDLISGQQLNLTCSVGHPTPSDLQLKWVPPEQSSLTPDRHLAHFTVPEVGTADGGKWRCELWQSGALLTSAEITLKIGECRKWEGSRKYDTGVALWPRSLLQHKASHDVLFVLHAAWRRSVSVECRTQIEFVDAGGHLWCRSHRNPPTHPGIHPLQTQTSTVKPFLFLSVGSHWSVNVALRVVCLSVCWLH